MLAKKVRLGFVLKLPPPNVFIGGPVRISDGFPIGAFGNDGILKEV